MTVVIRRRRARVGALVVAAVVTVAVAAEPAVASVRPGQEVRSGMLSVPVRTCHDDFQSITPGHKPGPRVKVSSNVSRPIGVAVPAPMTLRGVAAGWELVGKPYHASKLLTIAAPRSFACSGTGVSEDDVSWATARSRTTPSHSITTSYFAGQAEFERLCEYLHAAHRVADARAAARLGGGTLRQCRRYTENTPLSAHLRPVRLSAKDSGPFAVLIHAPAGSEHTGPAVTGKAKVVSGRKTTTPTVSVAIMAWTSRHSFHWPTSIDCSLPASAQKMCATSAAVFADQALRNVYGWTAKAAARAGNKIRRMV